MCKVKSGNSSKKAQKITEIWNLGSESAPIRPPYSPCQFVLMTGTVKNFRISDGVFSIRSGNLTYNISI